MKNLNLKNIYVLMLSSILLVSLIGCHQKHKSGSRKVATQYNASSASGQDPIPNTLTKQEKKEGWKLLFDGKHTNKWRKAYGKKFPKHGWVVHDGVLTVLASNGDMGGTSGTIVTKREYSNFEFELDFKLTKGANSGIKYFVIENPDYFNGSPKGRAIGLEYQIIDGKNWPQKLNDNQLIGALYDMIPTEKNKLKANSVGQWNHARIVCKGKHVEHWLNGKKLLEYTRGSDAFRALYLRSKYKKYKNFGLAPKGHIALQNHGTKVSFRNIKIRILK